MEETLCLKEYVLLIDCMLPFLECLLLMIGASSVVNVVIYDLINGHTDV